MDKGQGQHYRLEPMQEDVHGSLTRAIALAQFRARDTQQRVEIYRFAGTLGVLHFIVTPDGRAIKPA